MAITGKILNVERDVAGSDLSAAATAGDDHLHLNDVEIEFDVDGGTLKIGEEVIDYTCPDEGQSNVLDLATTLASSYPEGTFVEMYPQDVEYIAYVLEPGATEPIKVRVTHPNVPLLRTGLRADETEQEEVELDTSQADTILRDIVKREPSINMKFADTSDALPSDNAPPGSSPTPVIRGGPRFLWLSWEEVVNQDPTSYQVHLSAVDGFTPDTTTHVATVAGTGVILKQLQDGSDLVYGTTYYARLIAQDPDGEAPAGAQASGALARIDGGEDIVADSITANELGADSVTAYQINVTELSAISADLGTITAGTITGAVFQTDDANPRVRMDTTGFFTTDADGDIMVQITPSGGIRILNAETTERDEQKISWHDPNGVERFHLWDQYFVHSGSADSIASIKSTAPHHSQVTTMARTDDTEVDSAYIRVGYSITFDLAFVQAQARVDNVAQTVTIIDSTGASSFQFQNDNLDGIAAAASQGWPTRKADSTWVQRILAEGTGISITNPTGDAGNPSIAIDTSLVPRLNVINTFTTRQIVSPATDVPALDLRRGTDTSPTANILRVQRADAGSTLLTIDAYGHLSTDAGVETKVVAGTVSDANFANTPGSGAIAGDSTNGRFYIRLGTTWMFVPVSTQAPPNYTVAGTYTTRRTGVNSATGTLPQAWDAINTIMNDLIGAGLFS